MFGQQGDYILFYITLAHHFIHWNFALDLYSIPHRHADTEALQLLLTGKLDDRLLISDPRTHRPVGVLGIVSRSLVLNFVSSVILPFCKAQAFALTSFPEVLFFRTSNSTYLVGRREWQLPTLALTLSYGNVVTNARALFTFHLYTYNFDILIHVQTT